MCVFISHVCPCGQSESTSQRTQRLMERSQCGLEDGQLRSERHSGTHCPFIRLQSGPKRTVAQSWSLLHPVHNECGCVQMGVLSGHERLLAHDGTHRCCD